VRRRRTRGLRSIAFEWGVMDLSEYGPGCGTAGDYGRTLRTMVTPCKLLDQPTETIGQHASLLRTARSAGRGDDPSPPPSLWHVADLGPYCLPFSETPWSRLSKIRKKAQPYERDPGNAPQHGVSTWQFAKPLGRADPAEPTRQGRAGLGLRVLTADTAAA